MISKKILNQNQIESLNHYHFKLIFIFILLYLLYEVIRNKSIRYIDSFEFYKKLGIS